MIKLHNVFGGRLKTRDWKTQDHLTGGGGKRETSSYGTPMVPVL